MGKQFTVGYISDRYDAPIAPDEKPDSVLVPNVNAPQVMISDRTTSTFGEGEEDAKAELAEFDKLIAQLDAESTGIFKERIREVANAVKPAVVR